MADPLDAPGNRGILTEDDEEFFELLDRADPLAIITLCEEIDEEEGRAPGTTLEIYLTTMKKTH